MHKSLKFLSCALALGLLTAPASAEYHQKSSKASKEFYVRGNIGFPMYRDIGGEPFKALFKVIGNVAAGMVLDRNFSCEIEMGYLNLPIKMSGQIPATSQVRSYSVLLNGLVHPYSFKDGTIKPFFGVGLGYSNNRSGDLKQATLNASSSGKDTVSRFAYQVILGGEWAVDNSISVLADVRWMDMGKWSFKRRGASVTSPLKLQTFNLGAKFKF